MPESAPPLRLPELSAQDIEVQLRELWRVFMPRDHWSNDSPWASPSRGRLVLLVAARSQGLLSLEYEAIEACTFGSRWEPAASAEMERLRGVAGDRRGSVDLKDQTWSAYTHLAKMFPSQTIEPHTRGLPLCYTQPDNGVVVTAGNIEPDRMLRFMLRARTPWLGVVGPRYPELDWEQRLEGPDQDGPGTQEVNPGYGHFIAFPRLDNSWHGHKPFEGERRVVQIAWLVSEDAVSRKAKRHGVTEFLKKLFSSTKQKQDEMM